MWRSGARAGAGYDDAELGLLLPHAAASRENARLAAAAPSNVLLCAFLLVLMLFGAMPAALLMWLCLGALACTTCLVAARLPESLAEPPQAPAVLVLPHSHTSLMQLALLDSDLLATGGSLLFGRSSRLTERDLAQLSTHVHSVNCSCALGVPAVRSSKAVPGRSSSSASPQQCGLVQQQDKQLAPGGPPEQHWTLEMALQGSSSSGPCGVPAAHTAALLGSHKHLSATPSSSGASSGGAFAGGGSAGAASLLPGAAAAPPSAPGISSSSWPGPPAPPTAFHASLLAAWGSCDSLAGLADTSDSPVCAICLGSYWPGALVTSLACGHSFHKHCVLPWLLQQGRQSATCPMCKARVFE